MGDRPVVPVVPAPPQRAGIAVKCVHDYAILYVTYQSTEGGYRDNYQQVDTFYCRKCLEYKTKVAREEDSRGRPSWYKG